MVAWSEFATVELERVRGANKKITVRGANKKLTECAHEDGILHLLDDLTECAHVDLERVRGPHQHSEHIRHVLVNCLQRLHGGLDVSKAKLTVACKP